MAKKNKKKKNKEEAILFGDSSLPNNPDKTWPPPEKGELNHEGILFKRFNERRIRIPKVDEVVKNKDGNLTREELQRFYDQCHVGEYVHMETKGKNNNTYTTNRIKFEFSERFMRGYRVNVDESGENEIVRKLSYAELTKKSFSNNINTIMRYINYFIEYFDDDDELMMAYFQIMFQIMLTSYDLDPASFIETVYAMFATDSLIQKVVNMVEYNTDETMVKKPDKKYDESIQLNVDHLKAIMCVSCLHKFIIPVVSHYCNIKSRMLDEAGMTDKDMYYTVFASFIHVFDEVYDICLYDKLYHTATTRVTKTNHEASMWKRRYRLGTTHTSYTNHLMREFLINISQKILFSKSAITFIHVCFDRAIQNELRQNDKYEFTDMKMDASDSVNETISRFDRWQMEVAGNSQKPLIRGLVAVRDSLDRLGSEWGLDFKRMESRKPKDIEATRYLREEFEFYRENLPKPMSDAQTYVIQLYYANKLGNSEDFKMMDIPDLIQLIMIMKRDFAARNYTYLQHFISGKLEVSANRKYNKRKVEKLFTNHPCYDDWLDEFKDSIELVNMDRIYGELKTIIACPVTAVEYEYDEYNGRKLVPTDSCVVDEFMRLLLFI